MIYDRQITISYGSNRRSTNWQPQTLMLSEFWEKHRIPTRGAETLRDYLNMKKAKQDDLKDTGGYICGTLNGPRRKANAVTGRDVITLDLDNNIPAGGTDNVLRRVEGLGVGYCVYSTRKHHPAAPRLRVLIPLDRTVTADEYEPCARKTAEYIALETADPTTFEAARLMYWPSCCADSEYIYHWADKPFISADGLLAQYADWRDVSLWPSLPGAQTLTKLAVKQGDPEDKAGVVGAFCRVYDVYRAMDELIPGIYEPACNTPDRYTYLGGSTAGGAVVYDGGKFLYSHHATDPCGGRLVNAFDLVRLHKFDDLDDADDVKDGARGNRLPSYGAMIKFAAKLPEVSNQMAQDDFGQIQTGAGATSHEGNGAENSTGNWTAGLTRGTNGDLHKTIRNIRLLLENLPGLEGNLLRRDVFSGKIIIGDNPPWGRWAERRLWSDADTTGLREFLEQWFKPSKQDISDTLGMVADTRAFHPVRDYLNALEWDGAPRLDTVFIDYMNASDTPYVRAVTRKSLTAAVARVMNPGIKYDYMVVFVGEQGRGKSMIINKLGVTDDWFTDSLTTFQGKEAMETVQGKWLIEIPEMHAFDKSEMSIVKAFITKKSDYYRAAYATHPEERPRQCVLFGTTNNKACLRDTTGNRRFWPIDTGDRATAKKSVFEELEHERDQIWAEAVVRWRFGETLYLTQELEAEAFEEQEFHREKHPWEDTIIDFINREIPTDWQSWTLDRRIVYWSGSVTGNITTVPRARICCREVWQEAFMKDLASLTLQNARAINNILEAQKGWEPTRGTVRCGTPYGKQRAYERPDLKHLHG